MPRKRWGADPFVDSADGGEGGPGRSGDDAFVGIGPAGGSSEVLDDPSVDLVRSQGGQQGESRWRAQWLSGACDGVVNPLSR
jgi:hypothetical protein